jgi:uncharacterized protein involved in exopolysaccharide biosynthesis
MEKKQKGEQFQIVDAANFPLKPIRPSRLLVVLAGLLTGIASGVALALYGITWICPSKGVMKLKGL